VERQLCKAPMSVGSLHGGGSYERHGLTHCFDGISKRRLRRISWSRFALLGGSPCRLYVPSCIVLVLVALLVLQIASARLSVFVRPYNSLVRLSSSLAQQCNIVL
jgi:hypothetical protein